jgi:hypothetical protein
MKTTISKSDRATKSRGSSGIPSLLAAIALAGLPATAVSENLQGLAKGFITPQIGVSQNGAPLLQSFYFRFTSEDHQFGAIEVVPNVPAINKASLGFTDKNRDDQYFYNITFAPYFGEIFRRSEGREFCKGSCTYPIQAPANPANYVFVIRGFYIYYYGGDHHIDQIKIQERNGLVTVALNDKNDDDRFLVDLYYAYIPRSRFSEISARSGTAKGAQRAGIRRGTAVIRGFNFDFKSDDHHIKELGVVMNGNGQLEAYYGDKNQDDSFDWGVEYAILNP